MGKACTMHGEVINANSLRSIFVSINKLNAVI
jgi:hypothetical protein